MGVMELAISAQKSAQQNVSRRKAENDKDIDFDSVETGNDGIPGGTGSFDFDLSEFDLSSGAGGRRTHAQI